MFFATEQTYNKLFNAMKHINNSKNNSECSTPCIEHNGEQNSSLGIDCQIAGFASSINKSSVNLSQKLSTTSYFGDMLSNDNLSNPRQMCINSNGCLTESSCKMVNCNRGIGVSDIKILSRRVDIMHKCKLLLEFF